MSGESPPQAPLPDGTYDAFVVDVGAPDPGDRPDPGDDAARTVEVVVLAGEHKGEVVAVRARGLVGSDLDLMGMPATLTVVNGNPTVAIDA